MTVAEQINRCMHELNVLHDIIEEQRFEDFDLHWQLDQVEYAKELVRRMLMEDEA